MSDSQLDESQNIKPLGIDDINAEIRNTSWTTTTKNISETAENKVDSKQISLFGGKNIAKINHIYVYMHNDNVSPDNDSTDGFPDTIRAAMSSEDIEYLKKVVAWCQLNERLHRWANLNFPAAKREYSDTLSGLFMAIFCN